MAPQLRYDGQVVVVTGAGGGLGKAYATFFASRGASVVVNDLGGSLKGESNSTKAADVVVNEIKAAGGKAVANYDSVEHGDKIIATAIQAFGRIDILINNAGILRDSSFKNMADADWDLIFRVHVTGAYKCTRAAWPHFRQQQFGRIINTASAAGLHGNFGQANYSAAKLAMVGFTETLAKEGAKYNIIANVIAPMAASRMTATVLPEALLDLLRPEWVVPLVATLVHRDRVDESGSIFECGGGHVAKLRWQRAQGLLLKCNDASYTPSAIVRHWDRVVDFASPQYPTGPNDFATLLDESLKLGPSPQGPKIDFTGRVALITGGGAGLGKVYCLAFARYGAAVVVNDLVHPDDVVAEIKRAGGQAVGVKASAEDGDAVVKAAIDAFGRLDIVVNNAGILRDKAFANMDDNLWHSVLSVHARGTYKVTKAAWPYFLKQKYGRVINTTSTSGIYGNFGQANYSAAKCAILGLSRTLAIEGAKYNIHVNTIAPNAGTAMTATILPDEMVRAFKPDYIAPLVLALAAESGPAPPTGGLYEVGSGWCGRTRWQRSAGHAFPVDVPLTPETLLQHWEDIVNFEDSRVDYPESTQDSMTPILANADNKVGSAKAAAAAPSTEPNDPNNQYLTAIAEAKQTEGPPSEFSYTERDAILYNLGIGAKHTDLQYIFEAADDFQVLPSFGVIPPFDAPTPYDLDQLVPNFSPMFLLHGEQYLEVRQYPIPTAARLVNTVRLLDVVDKGPGGAAIVKSAITTRNYDTGADVFYNELTVFLRGCGGFGGPKKPAEVGALAARRANKPPGGRAPDVVVEEKTRAEQAALYRLSGDYNPLHIDPAFAKVGGFPAPILHGLCTFGFAAKAVYERFGAFANIKVRFAGVVVPGQTLVTEMWKEGPRRIVFQTKVKETGKLAIASAAAELVGEGK